MTPVLFTAYNKLTGEIGCSGASHDPKTSLREGQELIIGVAGEVQKEYVDLATKTLRKMPPRPSEHHDFDYGSRTWKLNRQRAEAFARAERDRRLQASDWTQLPDVPAATKESWAAYRQALRDVPGQAGFPENIEWPSAPS